MRSVTLETPKLTTETVLLLPLIFYNVVEILLMIRGHFANSVKVSATVSVLVSILTGPLLNTKTGFQDLKLLYDLKSFFHTNREDMGASKEAA